ncbi:hypothetical protein CVT26_001464 [Gymnopilus dilepis]|uniref:Uncharacterized protein n=1 Tax=Gymnopilus dilepis TaxID=231916 RepID=A0A409WEE6_9AGAR|nr:hypothetical protein CVT26_001464 [Gymnopilus dilepis]
MSATFGKPSNVPLPGSMAHKELCQANLREYDIIAAATLKPEQRRLLHLSADLKISEIDKTLRNWIKFHNQSLMLATIHALELPYDIRRACTHVLRVRIQPRKDVVPTQDCQCFSLICADIMEQSAARDLGPVWTEGLRYLSVMREELEAEGRGTVAAIALECEPFGIQFIPFGSLKGLVTLPVMYHWRSLLKRALECGDHFLHLID